MGDQISCGEPILQDNCIIWSLSIPPQRNNSNTELCKCKLTRKFYNLYTYLQQQWMFYLCTLAKLDYGPPFLVTILDANR